MDFERVKQPPSEVGDPQATQLHPFDPLSTSEIDAAVAIVRETHDGPLKFNTVTLSEPRKTQMMAWLEDPGNSPRPHRAAEVVAITPDGKLYDGIVDLTTNAVVEWNLLKGVQPLVTMEDLQFVEHMARKDEDIIKQCEVIGIPREDMHKVYCDRELVAISSALKSNLSLTFDNSVDYWIR